MLATVAIATLALLGANRPQQAEAQSGSPIVDAAMRHLGTHGGQCWTFMREVVAEATGRQVGFDYRQGFFEAGAVEVSADEAVAGDIIQIASDSNTAAWASYPGLHTAIVMENLGGGVFNAIDSNQNWDEWVNLRPNYNPYDAAARYGLQVHIYRIPGGASGDAAIPASVSTNSTEWAAGDSATVAAGGDCLNLRTGPSLSAGRIECIPSGTAVSAVGSTVAADGFIWLEVSSPQGTGWVAAMYLSKTSTAVAAEPPPPPPAPEPDLPPLAEPVAATALGTARVDNSPGCLRFRDQASLAGAVRDCLVGGTPVTVLNETTVAAEGYAWINVQTPAGYQGWVASEFLIR
ncbi:MAG: SH3 domain-containing protein [Dehalococcoidia bacterium]